MIGFRVILSAPARAALNRGLVAGLGQAVAREMDRQNQLTIGVATEKRLSFPKDGPTTMEGLRVITNRLRRSIRAEKATVNGSIVSGGIGSNVKYAAVHEFGFDGEVQIPAHQRRHPLKFKVNDQLVSLRQAERLGAFNVRRGKPKPQRAAGLISVKAHTKKLHIPARRYIGRTIEERAPEYNRALSQAIIDFFGPATA